uniref:Uncharacterized protein n=1 Tax=viral metagenome TaxID=1070528 RepID=A0A6C0LQR0_9ZZZZ
MTISKNIILIVIVFLTVGITSYIYFNYKNNNNEKCHTYKVSMRNKNPHKQKDKKCVRFDDMITYHIPEHVSPRKSSKCQSPIGHIRDQCPDSPININSILSEKMDSINTSDDLSPNVKSNNISAIQIEDRWDASFGLPLMNKDEKKDYFDKMQKNFVQYSTAISDYNNYQTDRNTVIKTDTTIDPFKPDIRSNTLKGKTVKEIYDSVVSAPIAKPKIISKRTNAGIIYKEESELNGGKLIGTNLIGFDGTYDQYDTAAFGNGF